MIENNSNKFDRLSLRMSVFAWAVCAMLGWVFTITLIVTVMDDDTTTMIAQHEPSLEDAQRMQQILPAAGNNQ